MQNIVGMFYMPFGCLEHAVVEGAVIDKCEKYVEYTASAAHHMFDSASVAGFVDL